MAVIKSGEKSRMNAECRQVGLWKAAEHQKVLKTYYYQHRRLFSFISSLKMFHTITLINNVLNLNSIFISSTSFNGRLSHSDLQ